MPSGPRTISRPGAGPGRGPRPRTAGSRSAAHRPPAAQPAPSPYSTSAASPDGGVTRRRSSLTSRAIALAVVLLILIISYATSLRIYVAQSTDIAATRAQIAQHQSRMTNLRSDLSRWQDPEYVQTQARERLGWVMPGEIGFKVLGENGLPVGGSPEIAVGQGPTTPAAAWWTKVWGSIEAADHPAPAVPSPAQRPPITEKTKPGYLATPR